MARMTEQDARELAIAGQLADVLNKIIERSAPHWGIASAALANVIAAAGYRSFEDNPGRGRKVIKEIFAASQTLLTMLHNEAASPKAQEAIRFVLDQHRVRMWAGSFTNQSAIVDEIMKAIGGKKKLDAMGALETVISNLICDDASSEAAAYAGLDALLGDMKTTVAQRFAAERHLRETDPAGHG